MNGIADNTPVIVGVGFDREHIENPRDSSEPYRLMVNAVRRAAEDAGSPRLSEQIESISIPQGLWHYRNAGQLIAAELGCAGAKTIVSDLGVLQLTLLSDLCRSIAAGEQQLGVVTGGEAKYRELRAKITGEPATDTRQSDETPPPDVRHSSSDPFCSDLEAARGFSSPVELFAVIESALRFEQGLDVDAHRDEVAALYSDFSRTAAANPHAWRRTEVSADEIRNVSKKNPMLAFPYTKLHASQWNVNQAVAILVCSAAKAEQMGLSPGGWIFPLAAAESKHVVPLAQQRRLHSHPGTIIAGERALTLAGVARSDITAAELYSCFPSAIRSFVRDLKLEERCPLSVTGAMPFAGGPFNHFSLDGVARMVEVLRGETGDEASPARVGLVSNLSGIFGKQGIALFSNRPGEHGYRYEDVTAAVAAVDEPIPLDGNYSGPATIVGYTVVFRGEDFSHGFAICDTPAGERTVVRTEDAALLQAMVSEEFCGRIVQVRSDGGFSAAIS